MTPLIENPHAVAVKDLTVQLGETEALKQVDLTIPRGQWTALIGPNGAGKTTLLKSIAGLLRVSQGRTVYAGKDITNQSAQRIVKLGVSLVPQGRLLFTEMSVRENLEMGAYLLHDRAEFNKRLDDVQGMFPILKERSQQMVALMSGGEQQMLAVARALMTKPDLILLDEPSIGLAPKIFDQILATIKELNTNRKTTIVIAEQNVKKILKIVDYAYVLESGKVAIEGTAEQLSNNEAIRQAYLGL